MHSQGQVRAHMPRARRLFNILASAYQDCKASCRLGFKASAHVNAKRPSLRRDPQVRLFSCRQVRCQTGEEKDELPNTAEANGWYRTSLPARGQLCFRTESHLCDSHASPRPTPSPRPNPSLGELFTLDPGEEVEVEGTGMRLRLGSWLEEEGHLVITCGDERPGGTSLPFIMLSVTLGDDIRNMMASEQCVLFNGYYIQYWNSSACQPPYEFTVSSVCISYEID